MPLKNGLPYEASLVLHSFSEGGAKYGAGNRIRTSDLLITNQLLYLLSYAGIIFWSGKRGSNSQPTAWKAVALPIELFPHISNVFSPSTFFELRRTVFFSNFNVYLLIIFIYWQSQTKLHSNEDWWRGLDSNQRRHSQRIYSPPLLAAQEPRRTQAHLQACSTMILLFSIDFN